MYRKAIFELFGSFMIVLLLGFVRSFSDRDFIIWALTTFMVYSIIVHMLKNTSKAQLNPILTINFTILKLQGIGMGLIYLFSQLAGSILGAFVLSAINQRSQSHSAYPVINDQKILCSFAECLGVFFLSLSYIAHYKEPDSIQESFCFQVGGIYTIFSLTFGIAKGGILNFGELFGPSLIEFYFQDWQIHILSHVLGCILANIYYYLFMQKMQKNIIQQKYNQYAKRIKAKRDNQIQNDILFVQKYVFIDFQLK